MEPVNPHVFRPAKELKGFAKVFLQPGEKQKVSVRLNQNAFAYYDVDTRSWLAAEGGYKILVGGSSRDLPLTGDFQLSQTIYQPDRVAPVAPPMTASASLP